MVEIKREVVEEEHNEERPPRPLKIKTKTRSNQKNKKRDNRPLEVKRAKLAEKGIFI